MAAEENNRTRQPNNAQQPPEFLVVGRIVRPHGIRGVLIIEPQSKFITDIRSGMELYIGPNREIVKVQHFSPHRKRYLLTLENLSSRDDAEMHRDKLVYLRFEDTEPIPEGEFYDWQLLGLDVLTEDGEILGSLEEIIVTGANDVYLVRAGSGQEILLPAIESVIKTVDLESNAMIVHLLPGLLPGS
jgi:16S rRNA processing protein RimM